MNETFLELLTPDKQSNKSLKINYSNLVLTAGLKPSKLNLFENI